MATTFNPADKSAGITLSNTNHTATGSSGNNGVRGTNPTIHSTGKWYAEYTGITLVGGSNAIGFAHAATVLGAGADIDVDGSTFQFTTGSVGLGASIVGKTVSFALDFDNKRAWARLDGGSWVGDGLGAGDPTNNIHGADISTVTFPQYIYVWLQNGGTATVNTGDSAFLQSIPTGFLGWDVPAPPPTRSYGAIIS